jgi:hypothetical protein
MPPNHEQRHEPRPGTRQSGAQIDATAYQLLYEMERRLGEKFADARTQAKEDISSALAPVLLRLDTLDKKFDDHVTTPQTDTVKKKRMPWWLPLLIGGSLAFLGERAARVAINALADSPPSVVVQPHAPPVITP